MSRIGPALVATGTALLLVPLAESIGVAGYALVGSGFVLAGSVLTFAPDRFGGAADEPDQQNCPNCGAPNEASADSCDHCETALT